ncbi:MAG: uroporphyrinogen decarboxylase family protein [Candidatus Bathyarchaeia archaeon]
MNAKERFVRTLTFGRPDRIYFMADSYWPQTINLWYKQGLPTNVRVRDYFGFDKALQHIPIYYGPLPSYPPRVIEETDRYRIEVKEIGIVCKELKDGMSMPHFIDFPVRNRHDWDAFKKRLDPHDPRRYPRYWGDDLIEHYNSADYPIALGDGSGTSPPVHVGFFGMLRRYMGFFPLIRAFYQDPDWVHEMMEYLTDFYIQVMKPAAEQVKIDCAWVWEDVAFNNGPLISPSLFKEFMLPCYKKLTAFFRKHEIDIVIVDSDGDIRTLIPLFIEGGIKHFWPLEARAKMDAVALRAQYGKCVGLLGNIDKRALAQGGDAIDKELESKLPVLLESGYIPTVDHAVSSDISFRDYSYYIDSLKKYLGTD